jgi:hypothetical protein
MHRVVAGPTGAELYPVYVLPPGTPNQLITGTAPEECTAGGSHGDDSDEGDGDHEDDD